MSAVPHMTVLAIPEKLPDDFVIPDELKVAYCQAAGVPMDVKYDPKTGTIVITTAVKCDVRVVNGKVTVFCQQDWK